MGVGRHLWAVVAILAGGGSHALWFVGHGEGQSLVGGRCRLWATVAGIVHGWWRSSWSSLPVSFHGCWCSLGLWWLWADGDGCGWWWLLVSVVTWRHLVVFDDGGGRCGHLWPFVFMGGRCLSWSLWAVVVVHCVCSCCPLSCVLMVVVSRRETKTNIVCYSSQIHNKQIHDSTRILFLPIPGNILV